jgi:hypothetical protein
VGPGKILFVNLSSFIFSCTVFLYNVFAFLVEPSHPVRYAKYFPAYLHSIDAILYLREYGLITEAHAQLSVVGNCSNPLSVCVWGRGNSWRAGSGGWSSVAGGGGGGQTVHRGENLEQFRTTES